MERTNFPPAGSPNPFGAETTLTGRFHIGSSGAITSQTGAAAAGFDVELNSAGQYIVTFYKEFQALKSKHVSVTGPASAAFPTTTGILAFFRDYSGTASETEAAKLQLVRQDTMADADAATGTIVDLTFVVQN